MNLNDLVKNYKNSARYEWVLSEFKNKNRDIDTIIKYAVDTTKPDMKQTHRNYTKTARPQMIEKLKNNIVELGKPENFEDVMKWVYKNRVHGFGELGVYDTALRLGIYFGTSLPDKVYLHAGAYDGALLLLGKNCCEENFAFFMNDKRYPTLSKDLFPTELQALLPHEIENFLCKYKGKFSNGDLRK